MKTILYRGWPVTQSCIVSCDQCGCSNEDHSSGTPADCVRSAREDGWTMTGGVLACPVCADDTKPKGARK